MRRTLFICLVALLFTAGSIADAAAAQRRSATRTRTAAAQSATTGPYCNVSARCSYLVIDAATGTTLTANQPDKIVHPASLTKLMTAYLLIEAIEKGRLGLTDRVTVSEFAASMPALKIGFRVGQSVMIEDLLDALAVKSANDAAVVIAEAVGGSERNFATMMTRKARQLGMNRTTFRNASGLPDDDQVTTAHDMATIARALLNDYPRYRRYFSQTSTRVAGMEVKGHNRMLERGEIMGGKTGYIRVSGYNLVAWAERDGRLLIGAVFGGRTYATRDAKMLEILNGGSRVADRQQLPDSTTPVRGARAWTGQLPSRKPGSTIAEVIDQSQLSSMTAASEAPSAAPLSEPAQPAQPLQAAGLVRLPPNVVEVATGTLAYNAPTFANSWAVQVGAYRDSAQAQQALDRATRELPAVLGAAYPRALPTSTNVGQLYRAQLIGLDERQAKAACVVLSRKGMQCLPMPPTGAG